MGKLVTGFILLFCSFAFYSFVVLQVLLKNIKEAFAKTKTVMNDAKKEVQQTKEVAEEPSEIQGDTLIVPESEEQRVADLEEDDTILPLFPVAVFETLERLIQELIDDMPKIKMRRARLRLLTSDLYNSENVYTRSQTVLIVTVLVEGEIYYWSTPIVNVDKNKANVFSMNYAREEAEWFQNAVAQIIERKTGLLPRLASCYPLSSDLLNPEYFGVTGLIDQRNHLIVDKGE